MTMHSVYFKEHEGVQDSIGHLSSASTPWWSGLGTQLPYVDPVSQLKSSIGENNLNGDQYTATKFGEHFVGQGSEKGSTSHFTVFPGHSKSPANGQKLVPSQAAFSMEATSPDYQGHFELGFVQPVICAKYPYGDQCYGVFSSYGTQITGRVMLPLNLTTDDGPVFVNAKQYHGIIRRRKSRAKAELQQKLAKNRKPYLHLSRHLHAMRRPRGCGGRFLNTKKADEGDKGSNSKRTGIGQLCQSTGSQNSDILQSDSSISPREANYIRSNLSGSEVTSMFSMGDLNNFPINNMQASVLSLSSMMNTGHGIVMPSKWIAAADNCRNLKV
ncbi:nuclear transcription factor Y subunit A-10-like [Apium graveolens]|uniref:nuclear transcription factor Y subunit A-10-like n=1 Tax=Apium graveolens TaxID=4045 RepID=UPI003D7A9D14